MDASVTDADRMLLALVANGGVLIEVLDGQPKPRLRPSRGAKDFYPVVRERLGALFAAGLFDDIGSGRAQLTSRGVDALRGRC